MAPAGDAPAAPDTLAVLVTAGHVDHGKTSLVRALTGMDTDRLPEEKARGISIELGFAWLERPRGRIAFIDAPGHERFVRQLIAGAAGVDAVVLVVAADEGVMPQTREHLDICRLLGIRHGLVVLTRADLAGDELLALAREDVVAAVRGTFLEGAPLLPFSIHDRASAEQLTRALDALVAGISRADDGDRPFLLAVDRAFSRPGFGTIVTGTSRSGSVALGDEVVIHHPQRPRMTARVRALEVHGRAAARAQHAQRLALNLAGVAASDVPRGARLVHAAGLEPGLMWDVAFEALARLPLALGDGERGLACFGASVVEATLALLDRDVVAPGARALMQLRLAEPLALLPGERWIFRGFRDLGSIGATLGGGRVLAPSPRRRRHAGGVAELELLGGSDARSALVTFVQAQGESGVPWRRLHAALAFPRAELDAAVRAADLVVSGSGPASATLIAPSVLTPLTQGIDALLDGFHREQPSQAGVPADELRTRLRPDSDPAAFGAIIDHLVRGARLARHGQLLARPGFVPLTSARDDELDRAILELLERAGLTPPRIEDLAAGLGGAAGGAAAVAAAVVRLVGAKKLVRVQKDTVFASSALATFETKIRAHFAGHEWLDAQALKELTGASRRFAIPLGEWLDRAQVTVRVGDRRRLRGR